MESLALSGVGIGGSRRAFSVGKQSTSRLLLVLKDNKHVSTSLPDFERFLKVWDLKVVNITRHKAEGTIELAIDARLLAEVRWVSNLAYDFFQTAVVRLLKRY